jgi:hypothetical protein
VYGEETPGGGDSVGIIGWYRVNSCGANLGAISGGVSQSLYESIDWSVALSSAILPGTYFALYSSEGSSAVSRTFEFYNSSNVLMGTNTVATTGGTGDILRYSPATLPGGDQFTLFFFDGHTVTNKQVTFTP